MNQLIIDSKSQYQELIDNKIGLKEYDIVIFMKHKINIPSVILGISFCEDSNINWDIE